MDQTLQQLLERVDSTRTGLVQLSNNLDLIRMDLVSCMQSVASQPPPPAHHLTHLAPRVKLEEEDRQPSLKTLNQSSVTKIKSEPKKDVCNCPNFPGHSAKHPSGHHHHHASKKAKIQQSIVEDEMPNIPSIPPNKVADLLTHPTDGSGGSSSTSDTRPSHSIQVIEAISVDNLLESGQVNINTDSDNTNQLVVREEREIVGHVSNEAYIGGSEGDGDDADGDGDDETVIDTSSEYFGEQNGNEQESRSVGEPSNDDVNNRDVEDDDQLKIFRCTYEGCDKRYARKYRLTRHIRSHTGEKPYKCAVRGCGLAFGDSSHYHRHIQLHSGERPFVCDQCGESFAQKHYLTAHFRTHTDEKLFICDLFGCSKSYKSKSELQRHQRKVVHQAAR